MAIVFPSGEDARVLKDSFVMSNGVKIMTGALDPSAVAVDAPKGSTYASTSTGKSYVKTDAGSTTNWIASDVVPTTGLEFDGGETLTWNADERTINVPTGLGPINQVGQELYTTVYNDTGATIPNGSVVKVGSVVSGRPSVILAYNTAVEGVNGKILVTTMDIPTGTEGVATDFGRVQGVDTSAFVAGMPLYIGSTPGTFTQTKPVFPAHVIRVAGVLEVSATVGVIGVEVIGKYTDVSEEAFDGSFRESIDFTIASDGVTITGSLSNVDPTSDLTMLFSDGFATFDTTPAATVALTPGTSTNPQMNYIYLSKATKTLISSTTEFPSDEHIKVADVFVQSAVDVQNGDILVNRNWNDHIKSEDDNGHILHISERLRQNAAEWDSGAEGSSTIGAGTVDIAVTSGAVYQLHKQAFPAFDTATGSHVHVVNDSVAAYDKITDIENLVLDANGESLLNTSYSFVLWGVQNKEGTPSTLMINLPIGSYSKNFPDNAVTDSDNTSVYDIPRAFKGKGFLIARFTYINNGGTISLHETTDLRGKIPNVTAGGGGGGGGVSTFLGLTDTPSAYTAQGGNYAKVNVGETALEFVDLITELDTNTTLSNVVYKDEDGAVDGVFTADTFIGNQTNPDYVVVQDGNNYNATDSTLVGSASVAVVETAANLVTATLTMDGTTAGSLMAFDQMSDPLYIKDHWYKVHIKYGISGSTDDLVSCAVYDNDVLIENQSVIKLPATNNQTKLATFLFKSPTAPTKLQVKCEQLVTSAETFTVGKLWYDAGDLTTLSLPQTTTVVRGSSNGGETLTANVTEIPFTEEYDPEGLWDGSSYTSPISGGSIRFSGTVATTTASIYRLRLFKNGAIYKEAVVGNYIDNTNLKTFFWEITDAVKDDVFALRSDTTKTLSANADFHNIVITATPTAESTGIAASGKIDLSNFQYPQYDISSQITLSSGTYTNRGSVAQYYQTSTGEHRLRFNITGASSAGFTTNDVILAGTTFKSGTFNQQAVVSTNYSAATPDEAYTLPSDSKINLARGTTSTVIAISGDVELDGKPTWATKKNSFSGTIVAPVAIKDQVVYLKDVKSTGTDGGDFTTGAWRQRELNTVEGASSIVSLSANQFTIQAGTYSIDALAPAFGVDNHKIRLRNITDSSDALIGDSAKATASGTATSSVSSLSGEITITAAKVFEIQHICGTTILTNGFGYATGSGVDEVYTQVKITKIGETGSVASTTDVIPNNIINLTETEYKCSAPNSPVDVYCRWIVFDTDVTASDATYLNVGTGITPVDAPNYASTVWLINGGSAIDSYALIQYDKSTGYVTVAIAGTGGYKIGAGTKIEFRYTKD